MTHLDTKNGFFAKSETENLVLNDATEEYAPFDYDMEEDILPHILNAFTDEQIKTKRELKNIKLFRHGDGVGLLFRNFDFTRVNAWKSLSRINSFEYLTGMVFINCRMGGTIIDAPSLGLAFYDCVIDERLMIDIQNQENYAGGGIEFNKCVFNAEISFQNIRVEANIAINDCLFNENSIWKMTDFAANVKNLPTSGLYALRVKNCIFKGEVNFYKAHIPERSVFDTLIFYKDINFTEASLGKQITFHNLCFAPLSNKAMKDGFRSFIETLTAYGYKKEAKFYEANNQEVKKIDKDEYDIALESGWLNIKQAALFLGLQYTTLLDMRKDDNILGQQRIPYVGKGKNSRYYVPLLKAYKDRDMKKVSELEKEMCQKENEI